MKNLLNLFENENMLIKGCSRSEDKNICMLSFTGVGHAMGGLNVQREEFVGAALKNSNCIFITDKKRSWGNNLNADLIRETLRKYLDGKEATYVAIGNSMGASNALFLAQELNVKTVIAFTPQYSVHPDIFPELPEGWKKYREEIKQWKYMSMAYYLDSAAKKYIFHGGDAAERNHSSKFPKKENMYHYEITEANHDVASHLKSKGCLHQLIDSIMDSNDQTISTILREHEVDFRKL